jgi:hypothetical protein
MRPRIDRPCPLDGESQRRVGDFCRHCAHPVQRLDRMDAAAQERLRRSSGPVCVSYRVAVGVGAALAVAIAPGLAGAQASALPPASNPAMEHPLIVTDASAPASPVSPLAAPAEPPECDEWLEFIVVGGVSDPSTAEWIELDRSLPDLPVRRTGPDEDA